ncbi:MAG: universal stress protein [Alphaproteobacteria bacterium]|nr:universal stress protein [Alphaproteobacteria bacterium]
MGKIIACIDGSAYADSVCNLTAWVAKRLEKPVDLLHVVAPHADLTNKQDLSGQIGLGAKSELMEALTGIDEQHGKLELKKGQLMLAHAQEQLSALNVKNVEMLHRRGYLVETVTQMEQQAECIIMGKRGEHANTAPTHLGSSLERIARSIHKPLLIATQNIPNVERFLIAYDGSASAKKAIDYICLSPLLRDLECHILKIGEQNAEAQTIIDSATTQLSNAGFTVHAAIKQGKPLEALVAEYIEQQKIDLLVAGAYGHTKIRSLILGSTTSALIRKSEVPVLLIR